MIARKLRYDAQLQALMQFKANCASLLALSLQPPYRILMKTHLMI
jgi:hypothetical protein